MKAAYDVGINFFDCAEGYAGGESERVMGEAIKKFAWKRSDIVVSTKVKFFSAFHLPFKLYGVFTPLQGKRGWA